MQALLVLLRLQFEAMVNLMAVSYPQKGRNAEYKKNSLFSSSINSIGQRKKAFDAI